MLNASIFEKVVLGGLVTSTAVFTCWSIFRDPEVRKEDAFKIRQELLKEKNVKMLYSTMSFFYLLGFKSKDPLSFITLQTILNIETPQIVAVPLSKDEFEEKYEKALGHPRFRSAMDAFKFNVTNKKEHEIRNVRDFNLKNLELLYLIDHCNNLKTCKVVYARKDSATYQKIDEAYNSLSPQQRESAPDSRRAKIEDYTDILINEMKPTLKFALTPESPFKHIVGIIEPELVDGLSKKWKEKFRQNYSHVVMEDEEVLMKQQEEQDMQKQFQQKFQLGKNNK